MKTVGEFIRFGNLSPQYHEIPKDPNDRSFHCPPVEYGFYAFPKGFVELYLVGGAGSGSLQNGRYSKFKDKDGKLYKIKGSEFEDFKKRFPKGLAKRINVDYAYDNWLEETKDDDDADYEDFEKMFDENIWEVWIENEPTHFKYDGLIWHHLFSENPIKDKEFPNYIKIVGDWVLTDMKTYLRILKSYYGKEKYHSSFGCFYDNEPGKYKKRKQSPGFNYGGSKFYPSKDAYEVYIESLQNKKYI